MASGQGGRQNRSRREREKHRNVRVSDTVWNRAMSCVKVRDDPSLSWVLRRALDRYIADTERRQARGELPPYPDEEPEQNSDT